MINKILNILLLIHLSYPSDKTQSRKQKFKLGETTQSELYTSNLNENENTSWNKIVIEPNYSWAGQLRFFIHLNFGTPSQKQRLLIDTGSTQTWVASIYSRDCGYNTQYGYDYDRSSSHILQKSRKNIKYYNSQVSGEYMGDYMELGDFKTFGKFIMASQCHSSSRELNDKQPSPRYAPMTMTIPGILGLDNIRTQKLKNIFDLGYENGQLISSIFMLEFGNQQIGEQSYIYFNISRYSYLYIYQNSKLLQNKQAKFVRSYHTRYWSIPIASMKIISEIQQTQFSISYSIVDTGSSITFLPFRIFNQLFTQYFQSKCRKQKYKFIYVCDCDALSMSKYPNMTVKVNQQFQFNITPAMYLSSVYFSLYEVLFANTDKCFLHLQTDRSIQDPIMGMNILRNFILIFDKINNQIGFIQNSKNKENMVKYYIGKRVLYEWFWTIKWICAIMLGFWVFYQGVWNRNKGTNIKISTKIDTDNNQESNIFSFGQNGQLEMSSNIRSTIA